MQMFRFLPVTVCLLSLVGLFFHCGLAPGSMVPMSPPFSIDTTVSSGNLIPFPVRWASIFVAGSPLSPPSTVHSPVAPSRLPVWMMMPMLSLTRDPSTSAVVHWVLMAMLPASLLAARPFILPLFAVTAIVIFGTAVMHVVPPVLTHVTVIICVLSRPGPIPPSVAVVATGLVRHKRRWRRVGSGLSVLRHAGLVMVVLVATKQRPITRFNNQRPVKVGLHVGPDVEGWGHSETLLRLQLTVEGLAARPVLPPQLVGPLLPHWHRLHWLLLLLTRWGRRTRQIKTTESDTTYKILCKPFWKNPVF